MALGNACPCDFEHCLVNGRGRDAASFRLRRSVSACIFVVVEGPVTPAKLFSTNFKENSSAKAVCWKRFNSVY